MNDTRFDADYYKGDQFNNSGSFTYEDNLANSRFNFRLTALMLDSLGIELRSLYDFGASGGFFMRYAMENGVHAEGFEVSQWCIDNSCLDDQSKGLIQTQLPEQGDFSCITSFFVLEHLTEEQLLEELPKLTKLSKYLLFRVPLLEVDETYGERMSYDPDTTHVSIWTFDQWRKFLWDKTDWHMVNAHYSDFGQGCVGTFLCVREEAEYYGNFNDGKEPVTEMFPFGEPGWSCMRKSG